MFSCDVYVMETYPTLSGTYEIDFIKAKHKDSNGIARDTILIFGQYKCADAVEPLQVIDIGERISFDYSSVYSGFYLDQNGGQAYTHRLKYRITSTTKLFSGSDKKWDEIHIDHFGYTMKYYIEYDGILDMELKSFNSWTNDRDEKFEGVTFYFTHLGP